MNEKKHYLVTGASSGIGWAISQRLLQAGYSVVGIARDFSSTPYVEKEFFRPYCADLADLKAVADWAPKLASELSVGLEGVILCAGQGRFGALETFSWSQIEQLITLNLTSQLFMLKAFLPILKQHGYGNVILIGSEAALAGSKQGIVYCASKFGLRGAAQSLCREYANDHIRTTLINPGPVNTDFFDDLHFQPAQGADYSIQPEDIAESVMHVLSLPATTMVEEFNVQPIKRVFKAKKRQ